MKIFWGVIKKLDCFFFGGFLKVNVQNGDIFGVAKVSNIYFEVWERSSSVVECLTQDWGATGSSLYGGTALCPWARHTNPFLVLVQPRKTRPYITEKLLMGCKETNQTNILRYAWCSKYFFLGGGVNSRC